MNFERKYLYLGFLGFLLVGILWMAGTILDSETLSKISQITFVILLLFAVSVPGIALSVSYLSGLSKRLRKK